MNTEPVAWMETYKGEPNNLDWDKENLNYGDSVYDVVPLYTAPRQLSVEEVENIYAESLDRDGEVFEFDMHRFADLILKKSSKK